MRFITQRLAGATAVLVIASLLVFALLRVLPGDPARLMLGPLASPEAVAAQRRAMGLDLPLLVQYWRYVSGLVKGDWGFAWHSGRPVIVELAARLPATAELAIASFLVAVVMTLCLGVLAVFSRGRAVDMVIRSAALIGLGTPTFWFGLLLLVVFFFYLGLFPAPLGRLSPTTVAPAQVTGLYTIDALLAREWSVFVEAVRHLVLPVTTLSFSIFSYLFRLLRGSLLETLHEEYMTVAAAKGLSNWRVIARHGLPNAVLPFLTSAGLSFGELLAGSVLVETVFLWPGIGRFVTESILAKDYASVQAVILLSAGAYITVNLIVDILYGVLNPRIRTA